MKTQMIFFIIILIGCKQAVLNHPAEGAGGILIGIATKTIITPPAISISNTPQSLNEGDSTIASVKLTQQIQNTMQVTIVSNNPSLTINGKQEVIISFTTTNATIDQTITLKAEEGDKISPETDTLTLSAPSIEQAKVQVELNFKNERKLSVSVPTTTNEEVSNTMTVKLRKKPQSNVIVNISGSSANYVNLSTNALTFTPDNFNVDQNIIFSINDIYNDTRDYAITVASDIETITKTITVTDNDFVYSDISAGTPNDSGYNPSIDLDTVNSKLLVGTYNKSNSGLLSLFHCNLDGTSCQHFDLSFGSTTNSGARPSLKIDNTNNRFLVASRIGKPLLTGCNLDFTSCGIKNNFNTDTLEVNIFPKLVINPSTSETFIIDGDIYGSFQVCSLDGITCNSGKFNYYGNAETSTNGSRGAFIDPWTSKLTTVYTGDYYKTTDPPPYGFTGPYFIPTLKRIDLNLAISSLDGETFYPSLITYTGVTPDIGIDTINSKILILSSNRKTTLSTPGIPWLFRCSPDMTSCTEADVSGQKLTSIFFPKLNIDPVNQKLLIVFYDSSNFHPYLSHCNLDGTNCKATDISKGFSLKQNSSEANYDAIIDAKNNRLMVVFTEATTGKLSLIRFGLGGF